MTYSRKNEPLQALEAVAIRSLKGRSMLSPDSLGILLLREQLHHHLVAVVHRGNPTNTLRAGRWRRPLSGRNSSRRSRGSGRVDGRWFLDRQRCLLQAGERRRRWRFRGVGVGSVVGGRWVKRCVCQAEPTRSF
jgi:hypothetical protein